MGVAEVILDVVPLVETQAAAAVPLAGEDVQVTVPVPVDHVGPGDHHDRVRFDDRDAVGIGELGLLPRSPRGHVLVESDAVLELAGHEVPLTVAVPVDEAAQIRSLIAAQW
jgi:hypothetical protein